MNHRIVAGVAGIAAAIGSVSACSFTPLEDVTEPTAPAQEEPDALAFTEDVPAAAGRPAIDGSPAAELLDDTEAAAWTVVTDSAQVGVHSAPGTAYTRVGVVSPGETVIATGRRVNADEIRWMEIYWRQRTGWVLEAAFAPRSR